MPFKNQSRLEPKHAFKGQQNQAPSAAVNGSSWGLLSQIHGQKADNRLLFVVRKMVARQCGEKGGRE